MEQTQLECLQHIIDIEKTCHTQEKLIAALDRKINSLGIYKKLSPPKQVETYVDPVNYNLVYDGYNTDYIGSSATLFAIIIGIVGAMYSFSHGGFFDGIILGAFYFFIGAGVGALIGAIYALIKQKQAKKQNEKAYQAAQREADRRYDKQREADERQYKKELSKYNALISFENTRIANENNQKNKLYHVMDELIQKHNETKKHLDKFYDFLDIYETYRNIVAACHMYEYFKSGICTGFTGHDGAYMVFKYEMYEKLKIEKLDTIISKLDQLHFDNTILNNTMRQIDSKVNGLISGIENLQATVIESAEKTEQQFTKLRSTIDVASDRLAHQNAIIAYNQECTNNELKQLKWLQYYSS